MYANSVGIRFQMWVEEWQEILQENLTENVEVKFEFSQFVFIWTTSTIIITYS